MIALYKLLKEIDKKEAENFASDFNEQVNTFLNEVQSLLKKIELQQHTLSSSLKEGEIKIKSFDEFFLEFKNNLLRRIGEIYAGFSKALKTSRKITYFEKAQHLTKQTEMKNQLEKQTSTLQESINKEKESFNTFLKRVKELLENFPTKGNLTCPGSAATSLPGEKSSSVSIESTEQDRAFSNLNFPEKRQVYFAKQLREIITKIAPEYQLSPPPSEDNIIISRCPTKEKPAPYAPAIHQQLVGQLFHPRLKKYKGFLLYHDVGSGKTYAGIEAIYTWYKYAIEKEYNYVSRDVLILAPTRNLVSTWQSALEIFFGQKNIKVASLHGKDNTRILEIGEKELTLFVIIECYSCPPFDGTSFAQAQERNWQSISSDNQKDFNKKNKYSQYPQIYSNSSGLVQPYQLKLDFDKKKKFALFISTKRISYCR